MTQLSGRVAPSHDRPNEIWFSMITLNLHHSNTATFPLHFANSTPNVTGQGWAGGESNSFWDSGDSFFVTRDVTGMMANARGIIPKWLMMYVYMYSVSFVWKKLWSGYVFFGVYIYIYIHMNRWVCGFVRYTHIEYVNYNPGISWPVHVGPCTLQSSSWWPWKIP